MKREKLIWLLTTAAGASPILEWGQGSLFDSPGLRFGPNQKFKITIFEDLHFGEEAWGDPALMENDQKTLTVMNNVLDKEQTNLVVLNGDLLSGEALTNNNYTAYVNRIVEPFVKRKLPWASTYGNHDRTRNTSPPELLKQEKIAGNIGEGKQLSWTSAMVQGPDEAVGTSNYFIPIYASSGGGNPQISMLLWFFDSRSGNKFQQAGPDGKDIGIEDFVDRKVVDWFRLEKEAFRRFNRVIPSLAFVHIPIQTARKLQEQGAGAGSTRPGLDEEAIGHQANDCKPTGECTYNGKDSAFVAELAKTEGLMAVFSGHDHGVDWCMKWRPEESVNKDGIDLCFGRHTGYGGYGKQWARGARQIVIDETHLAQKAYDVDTWIRLEDGSISGHVMLNSSYGQDAYPPAVANSLGNEPQLPAPANV
ncbi:Metallo-dependent phosphatase [Aaosphaeria arxii CBS 175.79]|uniref:Metallo-dependent phosphatase n=1 Tax=Aaosphaeria arxii CBS 175.79 TaxID=1450172 RepID=A0A6A5XY69_9PLEO|nr:Metallo-dependent phosphatase [Aaosphaeria arxii CBS 175.79]KAF2017661.1 Metallo-dependent phosphatase [Aaosphaeria arxii CBS 175.79]